MTTTIYMPDDHIITQGEPADKLYFLAIGHLEVWILNEYRKGNMV